MKVTIAKFPKFSVNAELDEAKKRMTFWLNGNLNEDVSLVDVSKYLFKAKDSFKLLVLNLEKLTYMNSKGLSLWTTFIQHIQPKFDLMYDTLSETFVDRVTAMPQMIGTEGTRVYQFEAPYHCKKCNTTVTQLIEVAKIKPMNSKKIAAPSFNCGTCNTVMSFDDVETIYLHFLDRIQPASKP
jgi:ABC-type transporter Mla MlaB component